MNDETPHKKELLTCAEHDKPSHGCAWCLETCFQNVGILKAKNEFLEDQIASAADFANTWARESNVIECTSPYHGLFLRDLISRLQDKCADTRLNLTAQLAEEKAKSSRLEGEVKELKTLNTKAKEVLEKTLDCEASACVARNRLEVQVEQLQSQVKELEKANRRLRDHLENLVYSVAGTEGTKTNAELPEWYRKRLEDAKAVLTRTTPSDSGGGRGEMRRGQLRNWNGRWRKATLQDIGIPKELVNTGILVCSKCGKEWSPVLKQDPCFDCQMKPPTDGGKND